MDKPEDKSAPAVSEPWPSPKALAGLFLVIMAGVAVVGAVNWPKAFSSFDPKTSHLDVGTTVMFVEDQFVIEKREISAGRAYGHVSAGDLARVLHDDPTGAGKAEREVRVSIRDGQAAGIETTVERRKLIPKKGQD